MRALLVVGLIVLILGVLSLFVPIRQSTRHGIDAGPISVGVRTTERRKVHPGISAVLIAAGAILMVAGRPRR